RVDARSPAQEYGLRLASGTSRRLAVILAGLARYTLRAKSHTGRPEAQLSRVPAPLNKPCDFGDRRYIPGQSTTSQNGPRADYESGDRTGPRSFPRFLPVAQSRM